MKTSLRYLFLIITTIIFISGCSINHRLSQYPSEEQFYEECNRYLSNRPVEVLLRSGNKVDAENGIKASGNTLYVIQPNISQNEVTVPLKLINSITYNEYYADNISGFISLNTGDIFEAENITAFPDSIRFMDIHRINKKIPYNITEIQKVSYQQDWVAIPFGFVIGLFTGFAVGLTGPIPEYEGPHGSISSTPGPGKSKYVGTSIIYCSLAGCVIGSIVGYLIGLDYNYYFQ